MGIALHFLGGAERAGPRGGSAGNGASAMGGYEYRKSNSEGVGLHTTIYWWQSFQFKK